MARLSFLLALVGLSLQQHSTAVSPNEFFETKIRPVLVDACFKCHGGEKTSGGLRLDSREHLMSGGDRGPAIVPADAKNSLLVQAMRRTHPDLAMPPKQELPQSVIQDFQSWINAGADWPATTAPPSASSGRHWAFLPIAKVAVPERHDAGSHPIDRFIAARQAELGFAPSSGPIGGP